MKTAGPGLSQYAGSVLHLSLTLKGTSSDSLSSPSKSPSSNHWHSSPSGLASQTRIAFTSSAVKSQDAGSVSHVAGNVVSCQAVSHASESSPIFSQSRIVLTCSAVRLQTAGSVSHTAGNSCAAASVVEPIKIPNAVITGKPKRIIRFEQCTSWYDMINAPF